jgi:hypothetical protein
LRVGHQGSGNRKHLLLSTAEMIPHMGVKLLQFRKEGVDSIKIPDRSFSDSPGDENILSNGQIGEDPSVVWNEANARLSDPVRGFADDLISSESDASRFGGRQPNDTPEGRGLPGSISSQQADRLSSSDLKGDSKEDMTRSVIRMDVSYFEHYAVPPR